MPDDRADRLQRLRSRVRRFTHRRRRPIAAGLAAVGVLLALGSLRPAPAPTADAGDVASASTRIGPGEAAVPIALSTPVLARSLSRGQLVDVVGVPRGDEGAASVIAAAARVIDIPEGGSGFSATSTPVIVVAVREQDVLPLVAASSRDAVALVLRGFPGSR